MHLADPTEANRWPDIASTRVKRNTKHTSGRFHRSISLAWLCLNACQPLSAVSIVYESHWRARMHFWKRLRIAALRKMQTPLSYNHCFRESWLRKMSTPLSYNHCFRKAWRGSHVLVKKNRAAKLRNTSTPLSYNHCFRKSLKGLHVLLKTISHSGIEENVNLSQL